MTRLKYFFVNDQKFCTYDNISLSSLILYFSYKTTLLVLEYNNLICNKENWDKTFIQDKDRIEIVTIVGGG